MNTKANELETLIKQAQAGDKRAYAGALSQIARMMRPYLSKRINNPTEAEDVLQEILVSVHKALHTYDGNRPFTPWVFAITRYRLQDYLRQQYSDLLRHAGDLEDAENISDMGVTEPGISYESIRGEVLQLPGKQPTILHLIHVEGYTAREVGERIGMKESAVKVAAHRAYKTLRKKLAHD